MKQLTKYRVAAVQAGPVFLDLKASVEKACRLIKEAAENDAKLVGFPEAFLPGYPWWIWQNDPLSGVPFYTKLYENAIVVGDEAFRTLSKCAKDNNITVCISGTEREGSSLYLTQFWFDQMGNYMGKHRKIKPTCPERTVWGDGDGSMMDVYDTAIGKVSGLMCSEHTVPINSAILGAQGQQVHVAAWPPLPKELNGPLGLAANLASTKYLGISNQAFVLFCTQVMDQDTVDILCKGDETLINKLPTSAAGTGGTGGGASYILNPIGQIISEIIPPLEEGIAYGDIDLNDAIPGKMLIDPAGHYARAGCMHFVLKRIPEKAVEFIGEKQKNYLTYDEIQG